MRSGSPQPLSINRKSRDYLALADAVDGVWRGKLRLPRGMSVWQNTLSEFFVRVDREAFVLKYNAFAIPPLPTFKLLRPFLTPPRSVFALELRRTAQSFNSVAICAGTQTVSVEEAKRLSRKRDLP